MGQRRGLIDSNVLIATSSFGHQHHAASYEMLQRAAPQDFATSVHCVTEFYNAATRGLASGGSAMMPERALDALGSHRANFEILALSQTEHLDAIRRFAELGGAGPRVYDYLIGQVAVVHAISLVVTWNVRHFAPLFPSLRVATPQTILEES